ncbi:hypothetical protein BH09PSE4_BH09PSE4_11700 [soil metagenome]
MIKPLLLAALLLPALPAHAATAPHMSIQSNAQLATPLPFPYDEAANADRDVAAAKARAKRSGKKLLIDLGGNWCGDCRVLAAIMEVPELKTFLGKHYEIVSVDVGRFNKNMQVPGHYGISKLTGGVPALLVINPRTDRIVNGAQLYALENARNMTPQALADWLAKWV